MKNGIDTSKNNGVIDWNEVKSANPAVDFVYIKLSEGVGYMDPCAVKNAHNAHDAGFPIGYYHFATLNSLDIAKDATGEADYVLSVLKNMPVATMPFALDIEREKIDLNREQFKLWITTFFAEMVKGGVSDYCIYSGKYFLNDNLNADHGLGNIRLWLAQYTHNIAPSLPIGWDKCYIWQYTDQGTIPGITTKVDLNKMQ